MRIFPLPFYHTFSGTTAAATSIVSMPSSSSNGRGRANLWRRGFCYRQQEPPPSDVDFVSGDSNLRTISASNYIHRGGYESGSAPHRHLYPTTSPTPQLRPFPQARAGLSSQKYWIPLSTENNSGGFYPVPPLGWPHFQFGAPPHRSYRLDSQEFRPQAGGCHQVNSSFSSRPLNGFRPRQGSRPPHRIRPADFRDWVSSSTNPAIEGERFKVLSYNILADYLARDHRDKLYFHIPEHILDWEWRKRRILIEFGLWSPDILCLQEVDRFQDLEQELSSRGYHGIWKMRTGDAKDGCAIFWRANRFELLTEESIEFNKLGLRDNVAQLCVLEIKASSKDDFESSLESLPTGVMQSREAKRIVVCNIHVLYNPKRGEIKLGQVKALIDGAYTISRHWGNAPVIICGDFNSTPKSPLYNFISMQKLNLSGLARDQVSGQYSSTIPLQNAPFGFGYHWSGSSMGNEVHVQYDNKFEGENCELALPRASHANSESSGTITKSDFPHQNGPKSQEECIVPNKRNYMGDHSSDYFTCTSDGKLVLNQPQHCDQHDVFSDDSQNISNEEITAVEKFCIIDANFEAHEYSNETDVKENGIKPSSSPRTSAVKLSEFNLGDGLRKENNQTYDCGLSTLLKESIQTSLFVKENIARIDVNVSCSNKDYILAHREMDKNIAGNKSHASIQENIADCNVENYDDTNKDDETVLQVSQFENSNLNFLSELHGAESSSQLDYSSFLSELHGTKCSSELTEDHDFRTTNGSYETSWDQVNVRFQNHVHDPYTWTPVESEIDSGNKDCTLLQHNLKLKSAYAEVGDHTCSNDSGGEPQVTSYNRKFMGTVDYIWFSDGLQAVKVLNTIPKDVLRRTRGFPTVKWGSDHIAIVCELVLLGDNTSISKSEKR